MRTWVGIEVGYSKSNVTGELDCAICPDIEQIGELQNLENPFYLVGVTIGSDIGEEGEIEFESGLLYRRRGDDGCIEIDNLQVPFRFRLDFLPMRNVSPTLMLGGYIA